MWLVLAIYAQIWLWLALMLPVEYGIVQHPSPPLPTRHPWAQTHKICDYVAIPHVPLNLYMYAPLLSTLCLYSIYKDRLSGQLTPGSWLPHCSSLDSRLRDARKKRVKKERKKERKNKSLPLTRYLHSTLRNQLRVYSMYNFDSS